MIVVDGEIFLSTSEVASRLGVSPRTILRWQEGKPEEMGVVTGINGRMYFRKVKIDETVKKIYFRSTPVQLSTSDTRVSRNSRNRHHAASA